jgi:hypothetical protein
MRIVKLATFTRSQAERLGGFIQGARAVLSQTPNASGCDPLAVDVVIETSGDAHVYLLVGRWVDGAPVYPVLGSALAR